MSWHFTCYFGLIICTLHKPDAAAHISNPGYLECAKLRVQSGKLSWTLSQNRTFTKHWRCSSVVEHLSSAWKVSGSTLRMEKQSLQRKTMSSLRILLIYVFPVRRTAPNNDQYSKLAEDSKPSFHTGITNTELQGKSLSFHQRSVSAFPGAPGIYVPFPSHSHSFMIFVCSLPKWNWHFAGEGNITFIYKS